MKFLKENKIIGLIILSIVFILSIYIYNYEKDDKFKDEYMKEIFVEENNTTKEQVEEEDDIIKKEIVVEIKGEVNKPDVYTMEEGNIVNDLINKAGGITKEANIKNINRAKMLQNNQLIVIPNINDEEIVTGNDVYLDEEDSEIININTANEKRLMDIPGIGEIKAKSIIDYREKNGGFKNIEELKNIDGIGEKTFEKLKDTITL